VAPLSSASQHKSSGSQAAIPISLQLWTGALLTVVAGFVDAIGYIELGGFFASFMSGASISLGVSATANQWLAAYHAVLLIIVFVTAATTSSVISGIMRPWGIPTAILLEAACLSAAVLMIESGLPSFESIFPVVAAMGIQNTALRPINGIRLGVTFMTGTLVSLSRALGRFLIGRARFWSWAPHGLIWCFFVAGAAAGAALHLKWGFVALAVPTVTVWALGAVTAVAAIVTVRKQKRTPAHAAEH
jgi:uncharacterized membrane protein YoaK (UPF0700 family)